MQRTSDQGPRSAKGKGDNICCPEITQQNKPFSMARKADLAPV